jgi:uncharacterized protein YkwD
LLALLVALHLVCFGSTVRAQDAGSAADDNADLIARETQLIYLVNLERDKQGIPPLRWNRELSEAARWFARDSIDGAVTSCDHLDSNDEGLGLRMRRFGYTNPIAFGELIVCGFVEPDAAVYGWKMNPDNEHAQYKMMLDTRFREAGVGYHYSEAAGRGMVGLNLAGDETYAPVVIDLEAPTTPDSNVSLYIYPTQSPPISIKISNSPIFLGASWQPYAAAVDWSLAPGVGWRTVYVLLRDSNGETTLSSDSVWVGPGLPSGEISLDQATSIGIGYAIDALSDTQGQKVRFSLGWESDDGSGAFSVIRGGSDIVRDATAVGGTALRLRGDEREALIHSRFVDLPANRILTMYVRAKVDAVENQTPLGTLTVIAGGSVFGPVPLRATDFAAANQWQELTIDFILPSGATPENVDLEITLTGAQQLWLDTLRIYSQPVAADEPIVWPVDVTTYRGQALQARLEGANAAADPFDVAYREVDVLTPRQESHKVINASPSYLTYRSYDGEVSQQGQVVLACEAWCTAVKWEAEVHAPWMHVLQAQDGLLVMFDPTGLPKGAYQGTIFLNPAVGGEGSQPGGSANGESAAEGQTTASVPGQLLQTWVIVYVTVDGADPIPPRSVLQTMWLPIARQK